MASGPERGLLLNGPFRLVRASEAPFQASPAARLNLNAPTSRAVLYSLSASPCAPMARFASSLRPSASRKLWPQSPVRARGLERPSLFARHENTLRPRIVSFDSRTEGVVRCGRSCVLPCEPPGETFLLWSGALMGMTTMNFLVINHIIILGKSEFSALLGLLLPMPRVYSWFLYHSACRYMTYMQRFRFAGIVNSLLEFHATNLLFV